MSIKDNTDQPIFNSMKGIYHFVCCCAWAVGGIGGFGLSIYHKEPVIAVCVAALTAMAFPYVRECFKSLMNKD